MKEPRAKRQRGSTGALMERNAVARKQQPHKRPLNTATGLPTGFNSETNAHFSQVACRNMHNFCF